jgi:hypothetical protein
MNSKANFLPGLFLFLFLVLLASLAMFVSQQPPNVLPASAPPAEFSAERAFRHVEALAREPRPVGTAAHARSRSYIVAELQALGLHPQIQETAVADPKNPIDRKMSVAGTVQNLIARLGGTGLGDVVY